MDKPLLPPQPQELTQHQLTEHLVILLLQDMHRLLPSTQVDMITAAGMVLPIRQVQIKQISKLEKPKDGELEQRRIIRTVVK